jgi:hypothetical protein
VLLPISPVSSSASSLVSNTERRAGCVWIADGRVFEPIEPIYSRLVSSRRQMPVCIHGDPNTMVTKLLFNVGQGFPVLNEETGVGMAEIMETDRT